MEISGAGWRTRAMSVQRGIIGWVEEGYHDRNHVQTIVITPGHNGHHPSDHAEVHYNHNHKN